MIGNIFNFLLAVIFSPFLYVLLFIIGVIFDLLVCIEQTYKFIKYFWDKI